MIVGSSWIRAGSLTAFAACLLMLSACGERDGGRSADQPTEAENRALEEAAEMLEAHDPPAQVPSANERSLPPLPKNALDNSQTAKQERAPREPKPQP